MMEGIVENFFVLTEKPLGIQNVHSGRPTRKGILQAMHWFVDRASVGDSLFFHFGGHGSQVKHASTYDADSYDETILSTDYQTAGHIFDDEIFDIMVRNLACSARLATVMDCCRRCTGMDLPYIHELVVYMSRPGGGDAVHSPAPRSR